MRKNAIRILLFIIGFILVDHFFVPVFIAPYSLEKYAIIDEAENEYNTIFIGASKILVGINPSTIETYWQDGGKVYNAGTTSQRIHATYFYLEDLILKNDVEKIVLGMTYRAYYAGYSLDDLTNNMIVYDRLTNKQIQKEFKAHVLDMTERYLIHLNAYRYAYTRDNDVDWHIQQIKYRITKAGKGDEINDRVYIDRGFVILGRDNILENGGTGIPTVEPWDINRISVQAMEYLNKIVELCKNNEIELIMIVPPSTNSYIYAADDQLGSYDEINDFFAKYASQNDIKYYNFNLCKFKVAELKDEHFANVRHLNEKGAELFSEYVGKILSEAENGKDVTEYFFKSFAEMRQHIDYVVCAKLELTRNNGIVSLEGVTLQENDFPIEYEFCGLDEDGNWIIIQEYGKNAACDVKEDFLKYRVNIRAKGSTISYEAFGECE